MDVVNIHEVIQQKHSAKFINIFFIKLSSEKLASVNQLNLTSKLS